MIWGLVCDCFGCCVLIVWLVTYGWQFHGCGAPFAGLVVMFCWFCCGLWFVGVCCGFRLVL